VVNPHNGILFSAKRNELSKLGAVAHACNPSYSDGGHWEDLGSRPAQANSSQDPVSTNFKKKKKLGMVAPVIPATWEAVTGGSWSRPAWAQTARPYSKNN
jgi:hypothetical protein